MLKFIEDSLLPKFPAGLSVARWGRHFYAASLLLLIWLANMGMVQAATVVQVAASQSHTVAVTSDGMLWAWGANSDGQLGNGTLTQATSPVQIGSGFS